MGGDAAALTALAPLKAEWLSQHLDALWSLLYLAMHDRDDGEGEPLEDTAAGVARTTAAHYPAHLRLATRDRPLLPTLEARIWSTYGGEHADVGLHAAAALGSVLERLRGKQPKLSPTQEAHLVKLYRAGEHTVSELEELFVVTRSTIYRAIRRAGGATSDAAA